VEEEVGRGGECQLEIKKCGRVNQNRNLRRMLESTLLAARKGGKALKGKKLEHNWMGRVRKKGKRGGGGGGGGGNQGPRRS